jgi:hypothetical protein
MILEINVRMPSEDVIEETSKDKWSAVRCPK